ncbi:MAG: hypothetical protein RL329_3394 [Bacteroidota bacterium]|jgi:hypothetical protein
MVFYLKRFDEIKFYKKRSKADPRSAFERFLQNKDVLKLHFYNFYMADFIEIGSFLNKSPICTPKTSSI